MTRKLVDAYFSRFSRNLCEFRKKQCGHCDGLNSLKSQERREKMRSLINTLNNNDVILIILQIYIHS